MVGTGGFTIGKRVATVLCAILLLVPVTGGTMDGDRSAYDMPEGEERLPAHAYHIVPDKVREAFSERNEIPVELPMVGPATVVGQETPLFAGEPFWYQLPPNGGRDDAVVGGPLDMVPVRGTIPEMPGSTASLLLTSEGIEGWIKSDDHQFVLMPSKSGDSYIQHVTAEPRRATYVPGTDGSQAIPAGMESTSNDPLLRDVTSLFEPWVEGDPGTVLVTVANPQADAETVEVGIRLEQDGRTVNRASDRLLLDPWSVELMNLTMEEDAGIYELVTTVRPTPSTGEEQPYGEHRMDVEVSRPLDRPAASYVRAEEGALAPSVSVQEGQVHLSTVPGAQVEIYRPWLVGMTGGIAGDEPWLETHEEGGSWVRFSPEDGTARFTSPIPAADPLFTQGSAGTLALTERPMWVSMSKEEATGRLVITLEDGDHTGQVLTFNDAWLASMGIDDPSFTYPDGKKIPTEHAGALYVVDAPHFSSIVIEDFECPDDCTVGAPPAGWTVESAGNAFEVDDSPSLDGTQSLRAQGGTSSNHAWGYMDFTPVRPPALFYGLYVDTPNNPPNWHQVRWKAGDDIAIKVFARTTSSSCIKFNPSEIGEINTCFSPNQWLDVLVTNINWERCRYTLQVDTSVLAANVPFDTCVQKVDRVRVGSKGWSSEAMWIDAIRHTLQGSQVTMDAEDDYVQAAGSSWQSRIVSAINDQHALWQAQGIDMKLHGPWHVPDITTTNNCQGAPNVRTQYTDWLENQLVTGTEAYQLWTARDLVNEFGSPAFCIGVARAESVGGVGGFNDEWDAASVVEGIDHAPLDPYDPDDPRQRALVSGHEFGHIYGEEEERGQQGVDCVDNCNIMAEGYVDGREFRFIPASEERIHCLYFQGDFEPPC